jgi:hypothetical protein
VLPPQQRPRQPQPRQLPPQQQQQQPQPRDPLAPQPDESKPRSQSF